MHKAEAQSVVLSVGVSPLWLTPPEADACYVFGHGAGAGMTHVFMTAFAEGLARRRIATLRYQFPYMEKKSGRPDPPAVCHAAVRAAVAEANARAPKLKLLAGGKSFGGRMTSQAQAEQPLERVRGLIFVGFPLHAAGKPSTTRANHLSQIDVPMLFLQGDKDKLAEAELLRPAVASLGERATLHLERDADHSFHVPKKSGRSDAEVMDSLLDAFAAWTAKI